MQLPRDRFVDHFYIPFQVHCLRRRYKRRSAPAPAAVPNHLYRWMLTSNGRTAADEATFVAIATPVCLAIYDATAPGDSPDATALAGALYDALSAAGIEVEIGPPGGWHSTHANRRPG